MAALEYAHPCGFDTLFTRSVPHILEKIFFLLDYETFKECAEVNNTWRLLLTSESFITLAKSQFGSEISKDERELHDASGRGEAGEVRRLLSSGLLDVNCADRSWPHSSALHKAAYYGHRDVVHVLLDRGADANSTDVRRGTPLHGAASKGHREVVVLLLDSGADCDKAGEWGHTPLHGAVWNGHRDVVEVLLGAGADPNVRNNKGETPLYWATWVGRQDVVLLLTESTRKNWIIVGN